MNINNKLFLYKIYFDDGYLIKIVANKDGLKHRLNLANRRVINVTEHEIEGLSIQEIGSLT